MRVQQLSKPQRRSLLETSSIAESTGQWHRTLRDGRYHFPPLPLVESYPEPGYQYHGRRDHSLRAKRSRTRKASGGASVEEPTELSPLQSDAVAVSESVTWSPRPPSTCSQDTVDGDGQTALVDRRREEAAATLQRLLVPLWRLHVHKRWCRAVAVVRRCFVAAALRRRERQRHEATDLLLSALCSRIPMPMPQALAQLRCYVINIQRSLRRHLLRLHAAVELNVKKVRRDVEPAYWADVVRTREDELVRQDDAKLASMPALYELIINQQQSENSARKRLERPRHHSATVARSSYELDVYNFYMAGPMPEVLLRLEIRRALEVHLRRAAVMAVGADAARPSRHTRSSVGVAERAGGVCRRGHVSVPVFLPAKTYWAIMDNVCFVAGQFRDDSGLFAHLRARKCVVAAY